MNKAYNRINWENYPSDSTPLNENNLNKMDVAIDEVDNRVISLETTKLPVATAYTMVEDVEFDEKTGVFTITKLNGSVIKIDTALEKISTNFRFDHSTQKLILTLIDGTTQEVDLSALLTQYEFTDSDTIAFTIDTSGKVVASVKKGSITQDMLEPNYLANIKVEVAKAESASLSADTSAKNAKTSETNAKTSEEKAREYAEAAGGIGALISSFVTGTNPTIQDSTNAPLIYGKFKGYTLQDGEPTPDNPVEINGLAKDGAIKVKTTGKNIFGGLALAQTLVDSGSTNVVLDTDAKTVTYGFNTNYTSEDRNVFVNFKENTQYTLFLRGKNISLDASNTSNSLNISIVYTDGTFDGMSLSDSTQGDSFDYRFVTDESKTIKAMSYGYHDRDTNLLYYEQCGLFEGIITADEFEPYTETTTAITTGTPLYEEDYIEIYADGSGKLVRAMAEVVIDGLNVKLTGTDSFRLNGCNYAYLWQNDMSLLDKQVLSTIGIGEISTDKEGVYTNNSNNTISIILSDERTGVTSEDTTTERIAKFNTWLQSNPVTVVYELAEPTETPLTAEQVEQFKQLYTFEPVTNVFCDGEVELLYYKNTDNGETVGIVHKKAEASEKAIEDMQTEFKQLPNTFAKKSLYDDTTINVGRKDGTTVGTNSITFGTNNTASGDHACAIGYGNTASKGFTFAGGKSTTASGTCSHTEGYSTTASGNYSHAEGKETTVTGNNSHAEGYSTTASGTTSHAEGSETKAEGDYSHAEGKLTIASGNNSHSEGYSTTASGDYSHTEGSLTIAGGEDSHAEGYSTTASGHFSHAEGNNTTASGFCSHAEGYGTTASRNYSHAEGRHTTAMTNQHAQGHYNDTTLATANSEYGTGTGTAFVIGNGTSDSASNAFRVNSNGVAMGKSSFASSGADYAEYFEWEDGNSEKEDRVGYFVTFADGRFIKKANEGDYILGIVSGMPCVIGNNDECWMKQFEMDIWGRFIYESHTVTDEETGEEKECVFYKVNPDYDSTKPYIHREKRPEWSAIGMFGVLSVYDDGTCQVNGYCKCGNNGIATAVERGFDTYRVLERINDNVIKVALK